MISSGSSRSGKTLKAMRSIEKPRSPGAPPGNSHARKHGGYIAKAVASRKYVRQLINKMRDIMAAIDRADQSKPNK
mgnify:CR=1 FL=1